MVSPTFLIPRLDPIVCPNCGRPPSPVVRIVGQALRPVAGTSLVAVEIDFSCPTCKSVRQVTKTLSRARVFSLLEQGIDSDRCRVVYTRAVDVQVPFRPRPSIRDGTPPEPISIADLERAQRLLGRTSFRRSTKGWKRFLKRMRSKM
jgi:hypothetical protein